MTLSPARSPQCSQFQVTCVKADAGGKPALIQSRVTDDTGYVQPTIVQKHKFWGRDPIYENNSIQTWQVLADGRVNNVQLS